MPENTDLQRLRREYAHRDKRATSKDQYSPFNLANLFAIQQRERAILSALKRYGFQNLDKYHILELGCGNGGVLADFMTYGAIPARMYGIDLLFPRLREAHVRLASSPMVNADGQRLPYLAGNFDLVLQFTAFSSILDKNIKEQMAADMLRVLKPEGAILWYDFWLNPTNKQTRGIRPEEIRNLFHNCAFEFEKITLAPPIARRVVPFSWGLALFLESLKVFNSHYMVFIRKQWVKSIK